MLPKILPPDPTLSPYAPSAHTARPVDLSVYPDPRAVHTKDSVDHNDRLTPRLATDCEVWSMGLNPAALYPERYLYPTHAELNQECWYEAVDDYHEWEFECMRRGWPAPFPPVHYLADPRTLENLRSHGEMEYAKVNPATVGYGVVWPVGSKEHWEWWVKWPRRTAMGIVEGPCTVKDAGYDPYCVGQNAEPEPEPELWPESSSTDTVLDADIEPNGFKRASTVRDRAEANRQRFYHYQSRMVQQLQSAKDLIHTIMREHFTVFDGPDANWQYPHQQRQALCERVAVSPHTLHRFLCGDITFSRRVIRTMALWCEGNGHAQWQREFEALIALWENRPRDLRRITPNKRGYRPRDEKGKFIPRIQEMETEMETSEHETKHQQG